jgi:hypothetical protein
MMVPANAIHPTHAETPRDADLDLVDETAECPTASCDIASS